MGRPLAAPKRRSLSYTLSAVARKTELARGILKTCDCAPVAVDSRGGVMQ